jgi:plasmid stability protein
MAEVRVRNLENWVVESMKSRAKRNGHSLEAELREMLTNSVQNERQKLIEKSQKLRDEMKKICGKLPDSTGFIRNMRDGSDK